MCMKYVNATVCCYKSIIDVNKKIVSYNLPFDTIDAEDKRPAICDFQIVTQISIRGTLNEHEIPYNPIEQKKKLEFVVRITKCDADESKRQGADLDRFVVDLEKEKIQMACFGFLNYNQITYVNRLKLPYGLGKYVIKVLVKESGKSDDDLSIQSMYGITVR